MPLTLNKPQPGAQNWDAPLNENFVKIEQNAAEVDGRLAGLASEIANLPTPVQPYTVRLIFDENLVDSPFVLATEGFDFPGTVPPYLTVDVPVPAGGMVYTVSVGELEVEVHVDLLFGIYAANIAADIGGAAGD